MTLDMRIEEPESRYTAGTFDPDDRIRAYRSLNQQARDDGYQGARVAAETSWVLSRPATLAVWPSYELRADMLTAQAGFTALCLYDSRVWHEGQMAANRRVHRLSLDDQDAAGRDARSSGCGRFSASICGSRTPG